MTGRPRRRITPASRAPVRAARGGRREVARIIDPDESTLLDVVDNLLNRGVVVNAEIVLALANVDLVHVRLAALLSAADRLRRSDDEE